ncbi:MAG: quinoprotein glucose dehydrogenase [Cyclobacteriaceae bacterium]|jgi:quinoprotein glucose dehydrogenase
MKLCVWLDSYKWIFTFWVIFSACTHSTEPVNGSLDVSWDIYRGDEGCNAYSYLDQINTQNVIRLEKAWTYSTGDTLKGSSMQCNPLIIDGVLYGTSPRINVFALDAKTGEEKWRFNPFDDQVSGGTSRGLTVWKNESEKRIFFCIPNYLMALDAENGNVETEFGTNGRVDLRQHLGVDYDTSKATAGNSSPGVIFNDMVIIGSMVSESKGALPGHIRAFDVHSGELKWIFHTIPHPDEFGYDSWPKEYFKSGGGANAWSGLSIDKTRAIVFAGLGAPTHDFYGGDRKGDGLFGNSVVALNAHTGEYIWHFQVSHHDLWDYDLPSPPNLTTIPVDGKLRDVVVQITKQGLVFILDRENGKPIYPIEERPVPQSLTKGEFTSPTQPFPTKPVPLVRHYFDEQLTTDISDEAHQYVINQIKELQTGGIYLPPSVGRIVQIPGFRGGAEWSGAAIDPISHKMYIGLNDIPNVVHLVENSDDLPDVNEHGEIDIISYGASTYSNNCASCHGEDKNGIKPFPALTDITDRLKPEDIEHLLKIGRGMMPSFVHLSENQRKAVVAFLLDDPSRKIHFDDQKEDGQKQKGFKLKAYKQLLDKDGYPGIKPPWGSLCALDLVSGEIDWKIPLGEYPELTRRGLSPTVTQLFGGGVLTAGDLIFIGASQDEKFRAIDKNNGEILWEYKLSAGGYATPSVYAIAGVQFIVIGAGGGGLQATRSGDTYTAFRLPDQYIE